MPILSASQTVPPPTQTVNLTVRVAATAAQAVPTPGQTATLATEPAIVVTAHQTLAPGTQTMRLVKTPWKGPATPRAERQPAKPR
jgi:hypothetical protein